MTGSRRVARAPLGDARRILRDARILSAILAYSVPRQVAGDDGAGVSSTAIRAKIRRLIAEEPPGRPLSDQQIVELLAADGVQVARRTVAKYREALGIAPSSARRLAAGR